MRGKLPSQKTCWKAQYQNYCTSVPDWPRKTFWSSTDSTALFVVSRLVWEIIALESRDAAASRPCRQRHCRQEATVGSYQARWCVPQTAQPAIRGLKKAVQALQQKQRSELGRNETVQCSICSSTQLSAQGLIATRECAAGRSPPAAAQRPSALCLQRASARGRRAGLAAWRSGDHLHQHYCPQAMMMARA